MDDHSQKKVFTVESSVMISNSLPTAIEIKILRDPRTKTFTYFKISPDEELPIPVDLVNSYIAFRVEHGNSPLFSDLVKFDHIVNLSYGYSEEIKLGDFFMVLHPNRPANGMGKINLRLKAPYSFRNCLPCPLFLHLITRSNSIFQQVNVKWFIF